MASDPEPDYSELVAPPTIPMYVDDGDGGFEVRWVNHDAVARHESVAEREKPFHGYTDDYILVSCPECDTVKVGNTGFMCTVWQDYEVHVSSHHTGTKWAEVTVVGRPKYVGFGRRRAGKHFRRNVDVDTVNLLDFTIRDDDSHSRPAYEATFEVGRWSGSVSNERLARHLPERIDFDAFVEVDVDWHHNVPRQPIDPGEKAVRAEHVRKALAADGSGGDGGE